jgi:hypothetical protein
MKRCLPAFLVAALPLLAQVEIRQGSDRILVEIDGKPFTDLFIGADTTKPYFHPLRSASGKVVTRAFPMDLVEGEARDHPHHRGLWITHGDVNGFDFWANEKSQTKANTGAVVLKKVGELKSGKKSGFLQVFFDWQDPRSNTLLTEERWVTFYSDPVNRIMDFDVMFTASTRVTFGDTKEGMFAIRLAAPLEEKHAKSLPTPPRTGRMTNAEGLSGEAQVWGKRSPWVDYAGELAGEKLGITIMDHPQSLRHPTYWHARAYGLFAANVFGVHDFLRDKSRDGSLTLEPGQSIRFLHRVLIHPGDTATANIPARYAEYQKVKLRKLKK